MQPRSSLGAHLLHAFGHLRVVAGARGVAQVGAQILDGRLVLAQLGLRQAVNAPRLAA